MARNDLTGQRFGMLTVVREGGRDNSRKTCWICLCDCGTYCKATTSTLRKGNKKSCGCVFEKRSSLCWSCANSTNGSKCPWARSFVPVPGWEAEKTQIKGNGKGAKGYESYNVRKCPLYRADREGL